jgi:hypothetical protein
MSVFVCVVGFSQIVFYRPDITPANFKQFRMLQHDV